MHQTAHASPEASRAVADEAEAEKRLRTRFSQVEVWHRTPLFEPSVGAELRADDEEWPYLATSQLVKVGLDVAAEHMYAVQQLINARELLPFSYRSILRTASCAGHRICVGAWMRCSGGGGWSAAPAEGIGLDRYQAIDAENRPGGE